MTKLATRVTGLHGSSAVASVTNVTERMHTARYRLNPPACATLSTWIFHTVLEQIVRYKVLKRAVCSCCKPYIVTTP